MSKFFSLLGISFLVQSFSLGSENFSLDKYMHGDWIALGRASMSILGGELKINENKITASKQGARTYKLVYQKNGYSILHFDEELDKCLFAIFSPVKVVAGKPWQKQFELSLFKSEKLARNALLVNDLLKGCSHWGLYISD